MAMRTLTIDEGILLYAERYALGRRTYAPKDVIDTVRAALPLQDDGIRQAMIEDIERASAPNAYHVSLGDPKIDAPGWLLLLGELRANAKSEAVLL
jgi:hypothetical protein